MKTANFYQTDRTYKTWATMKSRCSNEKLSHYKHYGGRGITVCQAWKDSFEAFLADMGERPLGKSLDRIDNDKGYYKDNCRWASKEEQQRNTSRSILSKEFVDCIYFAQDTSGLGQRELARQLAEIWGIKMETIREVLKGRCWKKEIS